MRMYLISAFFLSLLIRVHPSNPDSEIVQDNSDAVVDTVGEGGPEKSAPLWSIIDDDGAKTSGAALEKLTEIPGVRIFKSFRTAAGTFWQEVGPSDVLNSWRDSSYIYNTFRRMRNNGSVAPAQRPMSNDRGYYNPNVPEGGNGRYPYVQTNNGGGQFSVNANRDQRPLNNGRGQNNPNVPEGGNSRYPYVQTNNGGGQFSVDASRVQRPLSNGRGQNNPNVPEGGNSRNPSIQTSNGGGQFAINANRPQINRDSTRDVIPSTRNPQVNRGSSSPPRRTGVSPDSNLFAGIVNDFAFKLVEAMNPQSNFVIAPLSVYIALSMCYLGTASNSKRQLEQAMGIDENSVHDGHLHQGIRNLVSLIGNGPSEEFQLYIANGMFLGQNFTTEELFQQEMQRFYGPKVQYLDFRNPNLAMSTINDWVSRSTRNMITSLMDTPPSPTLRLLLLNAVYFKGVWKTQFPLSFTRSGSFYPLDGNVKEVPTMALFSQTLPLYRSDDSRHSFLKLPYLGDQVSMIIALPYARGDNPMPSIRSQTLCHVLDAMRDTNLDAVNLPKFKLEDSRSLARPLMQLGISDIFNSGTVDLRRLRRQNDVYVSAIVQKTVVEVNEEGTTAASVTGVRIQPLMGRNMTEFIANHPFAFFIVHEPSGLVLFYGKIYDFGGNAAGGNSAGDNAAGGNAAGGNGRPNARTRPNSDAAPSNEASASRNQASRVRMHGAVNYDSTK